MKRAVSDRLEEEEETGEEGEGEGEGEEEEEWEEIEDETEEEEQEEREQDEESFSKRTSYLMSHFPSIGQFPSGSHHSAPLLPLK